MNIWMWIIRRLYFLCGCTSNDHSQYDIDDVAQYSTGVRDNWAQLCRDITNKALKIMGYAGTWLDVGAGTGNFCNFMRIQKIECDLIEVSIPEKKRLVESGYTVYGSFSELSKTYDKVFCNAVIEHVLDVRGFCRDLFESTTPGGLVFVGTINEICILLCASICRLLTFGLWDASKYVTRFHVHYFSKSGWLRLLKEAGFELVEVWTYPYSRNAKPIRRIIHKLLKLQYICMVVRKPIEV